MDGNMINHQSLSFSDVMRVAPGLRISPLGDGRSYVITDSRNASNGCVNFYVDNTLWQTMTPATSTISFGRASWWPSRSITDRRRRRSSRRRARAAAPRSSPGPSPRSGRRTRRSRDACARSRSHAAPDSCFCENRDVHGVRGVWRALRPRGRRRVHAMPQVALRATSARLVGAASARRLRRRAGVLRLPWRRDEGIRTAGPALRDARSEQFRAAEVHGDDRRATDARRARKGRHRARRRETTSMQQHGFLHAGVLASAADSACGYAALSLMPAGAAVSERRVQDQHARAGGGRPHRGARQRYPRRTHRDGVLGRGRRVHRRRGEARRYDGRDDDDGSRSRTHRLSYASEAETKRFGWVR